MTAEDRVDTLEGVNPRGQETTGRILRGRRILYGATTAVLTLLMLGAVLGALTTADTFGVDAAHAQASGGGYDLDVEHATVTRGGMATPFAIEVTRAGGFDGPVTIAVDHSYMQAWDENGFYPTPSSETTMGEWLVWEFDPPEGDTLRFTYDGRIEPAVQSGRSGRVAVLEADAPVVEVELHMRVMP